MLDSERREYFRLKDGLSVEYREIDESEFGVVRKRILYDSQKVTLETLKRQLGDLRSLKPVSDFNIILSYLDVIDKKLDMIVERIESKTESPVYLLSSTTLDISGSGVRFLSRSKPEKRYLELVISLPGSSEAKIRTIAEIVRFKEEPVDGQLFWEIAARYVEITEEARDMLVSYIFRRQREIMKKTRDDE
ncbi:MAG: PilZ domain-containing protein [Desulfobacterota bacterium]|nr:PilZ domain-containing protein [Thermodesulfobacteriota bacterium]MDW8002573.1 PilZ domain-containing protein [Deltaproteobacteria bacterium]